MADRVELAFRQAATRLIPADRAVLAAVSGGGDSIALVNLLARRAARHPFRLAVAHLDHGLRRGSRADRRFVERQARELGLPIFAERREVAEARRSDESPEEAARRVRRAFLVETAGAQGYDLVATGHNLDDQAETVLMRLVRGAGASALGGMAESGPGPFVRPLLSVEREQLRRWLERRGIEFRDDPSNRDLRFDRNRVRRRILPVLAEGLNPRAARHLVQAAGRIREDAHHLDAEARARLDELTRRSGGRLLLDARGLAEQSAAIGKRVARLALARAGIDPRRIAARHVEALVDLAQGGAGREVHLPGRHRARRTRRYLAIGLNGRAD